MVESSESEEREISREGLTIQYLKRKKSQILAVNSDSEEKENRRLAKNSFTV